MSLRTRLFSLLGIASVAVASPAKNETNSAPDPNRVGFEFALYFAPKPKTDPEAALATLLQKDFASLSDYVALRLKWSDIGDYAPPTPEAFRHTTRGMEMEQGARIAKSERVFVLGFEARRGDLLRANREANALVHSLAVLTDGFPWDEECRLLYSAAAWRERRVATWQGDIPDIRSHMNMHAYRNPDLVRIITLGMRKFGLPDLVVAQVPSGNSRAAGNTINACAQRMIEGQSFADGRLELVLSEIRHDPMGKSALAKPLPGATGRMTIHLPETPWEEGDPKNRLLALEFPDAPGVSAIEKQAAAFALLFGAEDPITGRRAGDEKLKAASEKARAAFFAKSGQFRKGFEPNERLVVKTAFKIGDQVEYMWVEVVGWKPAAIEGILMNDSHFDEKLREGRKVSVDLMDVYDYIHYKPDGTQDGNETGKVLNEGEQP